MASLTGDFLQSGVVFLTAAVVAVPLAQRAGLGSVLAIYWLGSRLDRGAGTHQRCERDFAFRRIWRGAAAVSDWS